MAKTPHHTTTETIIQKESFFDTFDANSIADWLSQNGKNIIYVLLGLIVFFVLVYRLSSSNASKDEKEYLQASAYFSTVMRAPTVSNEAAAQDAFNGLAALMKSHPELHAAYDGALGQILLNRGQISEAKPFIIDTLKRTQAHDLISYNNFANATLLISEAKYQEALERSLALQQTMLGNLNQYGSSDYSFSDVLFAFNLLRIAMLHQELGNKKEELQTWQQWKSYAGLDKSKAQPLMNSKVFHLIIQQLATGDIALPDYIAHREKLLQ